MRRNRPTAAFTLTELLVVISIIGILTAMLLPSVKLIQAQARQTDCGNRMRQMGMASVAYQSDWEGWLPSSAMVGGGTAGNGSTVGLETYFGYDTLTEFKASRAVRCTEFNRQLTQAKAVIGSNASDLFGSNRNIWWSYNPDGTLNNGGGGVMIATAAQIKSASAFYTIFCGNMRWYAEVGNGAGNYWRPNFIHRPTTPLVTSSGGYGVYGYDQGIVNVVFADGHVQGLRSGGSATNADDGAIPLQGGGASATQFNLGWSGK
jgi:prepilin-type N-terminal cleavage/methylation domain-containing protein/prepilin-type processing-associated H-X9-DG protein